MRRPLPRNTLFTASLIAIAIIAGCKSSPETTAEVPADTPVPQDGNVLDRIEVTGDRMKRAEMERGQLRAGAAAKSAYAPTAPPPAMLAYQASAADGYAMAAPVYVQPQPANTEKYEQRTDNPVHRASEEPVSTFSVDVDTGSYSNVRRMLRDGVRPPADCGAGGGIHQLFQLPAPGPGQSQRALPRHHRTGGGAVESAAAVADDRDQGL